MDIASPTRPKQREPVTNAPQGEGHATDARLRLSGTSALSDLPSNDPRLAALSAACAVAAALEAEAAALDRRLADAQRVDPMRQIRGCTALEAAAAEARSLMRELDEMLCAAAEDARRSAGRTHPKGGA
jgi:hypothetical protein